MMLNIPEEEMVPRKRGFVRCPSPLLGTTHAMNNLNICPSQRKRASSFKKPKEHVSDMLSADMRPRTSSMPTRNSFRKPLLQRTHLGLNIEPDLDTYTVRSFHMNSKGMIVYRSDSLRSRSTNSVFSSEGEFCPLSPSSRTSSSMSRDSTGCVASPGSVNPTGPFPVRVLVLGSSGVGKTALTEQFLTSEYLGGFDTSLDGEVEKSVNVCLDETETSLLFDILPIDTEGQTTDIPYDSSLLYLVVYACDDKISFDRAVDLLYDIRKKERRDEVVILVGNKSDLVRTRCVTTDEAKAVAVTYGCKFVETSVVLNVNVDELLVGVVKQIRLSSGDTNQSTGCAASSKRLITKLFKKDNLSKSCGNLYN